MSEYEAACRQYVLAGGIVCCVLGLMWLGLGIWQLWAVFVGPKP